MSSVAGRRGARWARPPLGATRRRVPPERRAEHHEQPGHEPRHDEREEAASVRAESRRWLPATKSSQEKESRACRAPRRGSRGGPEEDRRAARSRPPARRAPDERPLRLEGLAQRSAPVAGGELRDLTPGNFDSPPFQLGGPVSMPFRRPARSWFMCQSRQRGASSRTATCGFYPWGQAAGHERSRVTQLTTQPEVLARWTLYRISNPEHTGLRVRSFPSCPLRQLDRRFGCHHRIVPKLDRRLQMVRRFEGDLLHQSSGREHSDISIDIATRGITQVLRDKSIDDLPSRRMKSSWFTSGVCSRAPEIFASSLAETRLRIPGVDFCKP